MITCNSFKAWSATRLSALVFGAALTAASPASAAVFRATWDPLYGPDFTNLGWSGSAEFVVPASPPCNTDGVACVTGAYVQSAKVTFYDFTTNVLLAEINWNQSDLAGVAINALGFGGGDVPVEFDTDPFLWKAPDVFSGVDTTPFDNFDQNAFRLQFVIDQTVFEIDGDGQRQFSGPRLYWAYFNDVCEGICDSGENDAYRSPPANFTVRQVPEPGTGALVGLALLAAGLTARGSTGRAWAGSRRSPVRSRR